MGAIYTASFAENVTLDINGKKALWTGRGGASVLNRLVSLTIRMDDATDANAKGYGWNVAHTTSYSGTDVTPSPHTLGDAAYPAGYLKKLGNWTAGSLLASGALNSTVGMRWEPTKGEMIFWGAGIPGDNKHFGVQLSGGGVSESLYITSTITFEALGG